MLLQEGGHLKTITLKKPVALSANWRRLIPFKNRLPKHCDSSTGQLATDRQTGDQVLLTRFNDTIESRFNGLLSCGKTWRRANDSSKECKNRVRYKLVMSDSLNESVTR